MNSNVICFELNILPLKVRCNGTLECLRTDAALSVHQLSVAGLTTSLFKRRTIVCFTESLKSGQLYVNSSHGLISRFRIILLFYTPCLYLSLKLWTIFQVGKCLFRIVVLRLRTNDTALRIWLKITIVYMLEYPAVIIHF